MDGRQSKQVRETQLLAEREHFTNFPFQGLAERSSASQKQVQTNCCTTNNEIIDTRLEDILYLNN